MEIRVTANSESYGPRRRKSKAGRRPGDAADPDASLTPRQREILQLLAAGKTAKDVAAVLGISARTVESHKYEIMRAVGVRTSAELVHFAIRHGITPL